MTATTAAALPRLVGPATGPAWQPLGSALTASLLIHALLVVALASIVVRPVGTRAQAAGQIPIVALLVGAPSVEAPAPPAAAVVPRPAARTPRPVALPPVASTPPSAVPAPWSALPVSIAPPPSLFSRPMVSEGVELVELRDNLALLGEAAERRIRARFDVEAKDPVKLKPAETIGYPIDALAKGVEGTVLVWLGVNEEGEVVDKDVLDGPPELMEWVLERVDRLVESPARVGQKGVPGWVALEVRFTRADAEQAMARDAAATVARDAASAPAR